MFRSDVIEPISTLLAQRAEQHPHVTAFCDDRTTISYEQLLHRTAAVASQLADRGLHVGDRITMFLDNCVEAVEGYLVAPRAGIVTVCADPNMTAPELAHVLRDSSSRAVLTDASHLDATLSVINAEHLAVALVIVVGGHDHSSAPVDARIVRYSDLLVPIAGLAPRDHTDLDEWCWMLYTSGTTGRPKGVRLSQRSCLWVVAACWKPIIDLRTGDTVLSALPLFHSYTLVLCVLAVVATGATTRLMTRFSTSQVLDRLEDAAVTLFPGVPTMFRYLLDANGPRKLHAPGLRLCISAGAVLTAPLNREFESFSGVRLLDGYGITETSTMVTMSPPDSESPAGSCGLPLPGVCVRLVDPATGRDVDGDAEGELWTRGPNLMLGYHDLPEATAAVLHEGWYRTGDLARRDRNGFLFISGRTKELIIRGGENIYPAEIEGALSTAASVADVAVVGVPHPALGEVPIAFVVPASGTNIVPDDLRDHCLQQLARYKIPVDFVEISEIPRTGSGKIRRHLLKSSRENMSEQK
ncbi:class I adenylate-forming enzyme family protein [Nocardia sp. alder85J]|uniref:class I adenylate-forming enzyme family protein n=1 Tax=Nocardia sp. alder85J TaxID=2862949 RepID=UPI001CD41A1D|nr:class I adenylate-forming enzyme family protein [Nocardia sp. alder85J]MCX4095655.1 class I adenylate-forming enzyme family protein [Nocardia sp. alder85J]